MDANATLAACYLRDGVDWNGHAQDPEHSLSTPTGTHLSHVRPREPQNPYTVPGISPAHQPLKER